MITEIQQLYAHFAPAWLREELDKQSQREKKFIFYYKTTHVFVNSTQTYLVESEFKAEFENRIVKSCVSCKPAKF